MQDWSWQELKGAQIADARVRGSLADVCAHLAAAPGTAFSTAVGHAGRQAASRIFGNTEVGVPALLHGHYTQTVARAAEYPWLLAVQDTTELEFTRWLPNPSAGPPRVPRVVRRLLAHSVLALSPAGLPLGLLHLQQWERAEAAPDPAPTPDPALAPRAASQKREARRRRPAGQKESRKWWEGLQGVEAVLPPEQPVLLIQDREGDVFAFLAAPRRPNTHLLVRAAQPRLVSVAPADPAAPGTAAPAPSGTLFTVAASAPVQGTLRVRVAARPEREEREAREAVVTVRATPLWVQPPRHRQPGEPDTPQRVWIVHAAEEAPPPGVTSVCWVLVTTLPLESAPLGRGGVATQALALVGDYALRWRIERLHYTLKSGLQVEALQHEEAAIPSAVALCYLVAWRLLWTTYWARTTPEAPAASVLEKEEVQVLAQATRQAVRTAQDVVLGLARLGGYQPYRSARPPGVKRLWQGYRRLQDMVAGYRLHAHATQSNRPYL